MREGSLIVNSSQGGGSKDTWVLADDSPAGGSGGAASASAGTGAPAGAAA